MPYGQNPPSNLQATAISTSQVWLTWINNDPYVLIKIFVGLHGQSLDLFDTISGTRQRYLVEGLQEATAYDFSIQVLFAGQDETWSDLYTPYAEATTRTALSPPENIQVEARGSGLELTWTPVSPTADEIQIERDTGDGFQALATLWPNQDYYLDTGMTSGQARYRLRTEKDGYTSTWATTGWVSQYGNPDPPANFQASNKTDKALTLTWTAPSGGHPVTGFIIEQLEGQAWVEKRRMPAAVTSAYFSGLQPDTAYNYRIKSYNGHGESTAVQLQAQTLTEQQASLIRNRNRAGTADGLAVFEIDYPGGPVYWTTGQTEILGNSPAFFHDLIADDLNLTLKLQSFWRPGFQGSGGQVKLNNIKDDGATGRFEDFFLDNNAIGRACRLYYGEKTAQALSDLILVAGGVISQVELNTAEAVISFDDPFKIFDKQIVLSRDLEDNPIPLIYGTIVSTGRLEDLTWKRIRFSSHRITGITNLFIDGQLISPDLYRLNLKQGHIVLAPDFALATEPIEITAVVRGLPNEAGELLQTPGWVLFDLCQDVAKYIDLGRLFKLEESQASLNFKVSEDESRIEILKRIMTTAGVASYNHADRIVLFFEDPPEPAGIAIAQEEIIDQSKNIAAENFIKQIKVFYSTETAVEDAFYLLESPTAPDNAENLELAIYGGGFEAEAVAQAIDQNSGRWRLEIELPFFLPDLKPGISLDTPAGTIKIETMNVNLNTGRTRITGALTT